MFNHSIFSKDLKIQKANYKDGLSTDKELIANHLKALAQIDLSILKTDTQKIAFWVNVYNGLTNYWVIKKKIKKKMTESPLLVMCAKTKIGRHTFTLDDIEHGILRSNRRSTYKLWRQFSDKDPRAQLSVKNIDYRIHFALNCGAKSCPPVAFYDAENLDYQLTLAEDNFATQEFLVDDKKKTISCSKIYWLYKVDFENIYTNNPKYKDYKISYRKYDFSI